MVLFSVCIQSLKNYDRSINQRRKKEEKQKNKFIYYTVYIKVLLHNVT